MKKFFLICFILFALAGTFLFLRRESLLRASLEYFLNGITVEPIQKGSVKVGRAWLDRGFKFNLENIRLGILSEKGANTLLIGRVYTNESILKVYRAGGVPFSVEGVKFAASPYEGLRGHGTVRAGRDWMFRFDSHIDALGLEEMDWLNPENLSGTTGRIAGTFALGANAAGEIIFSLRTRVEEPGGQIQARMFEALLPYLPQSVERAKLKIISGQQAFVRYREADFGLDLAGKDRLKVLFRILIPEYNLKLNLNVEIRVDKENAFADLAKLIGLIKVT